MLVAMSSFAQPTTEIFPDFTYSDLEGNVHHLQSYLDEGKYVVIDVFATWCPNCQNSVPGYEELYNLHGQAGDGTMVLLSFERDPNTQNEATYAETYMVESPIITGAEAEIASTWNVSYQPRYFVICPDGTFDSSVSSPIGTNPQPLIDAADGCPTTVNSVNEITTDNFEIYSLDENRLSYASNADKLDFVILDLTGSTVVSGIINEGQGSLDISGLHTGIYLISVSNEKSVMTLRFLKQ